MQKRTIALPCAIPGTETTVTAFCYGPQDAQRHIYLQGSLHADEMPGSLVAYHLCQRLDKLEAQGALQARITVVPLCNTAGLRQSVLFSGVGRFDMAIGQNYNRLRTVPFYERVLARLQQNPQALGQDAQANRTTIRAAMRAEAQAWQPTNAIEALHSVLLQLACDADVVLDMHCDNDAVLHMYTMPQLWPHLEPLACWLQSHCQMLSEDSNSDSFDEIFSTPWLKLQREFPHANIPLACHSATIEFRGERDLSHGLAAQDADALLQYLNHQGDVRLPEADIKPMPALIRQPHPLSGLTYVKAPMSGIVVYHAKVGTWVKKGDLLADVIDPIAQKAVPVHSPIDGFLYATADLRFVRPEHKLVSISGAQDTGNTGLSP